MRRAGHCEPGGRWVAAAGKEEAAASRAAANQGGNASSRVSQGNSHEHGRSLARGGARRKRKLAQRWNSWTTFHLTLKHILAKWLIPLAPADQDVVGGGLEGEAEAEQALEGGGGRPAATEAEDELVEVRLQVLRPQ